MTQRIDQSALAAETDHDSKTLMDFSAEIRVKDGVIGVGETVGKYEIRAILGAGGMGAVYLAYDPLIEREVALKVLSSDVKNSETALQRFLGEARAIGRLNHPHVVSIYDIDQWGGTYYLVMELLSGGSVAKMISQVDRVPWQEATRIVASAARGLEAAHQAGLIHRDIKPDNLMLTEEGSVKVVDFGLSKLQDSAQDTHAAVTKAGQILGTPQYMSPEQFESSEVDLRTDIYSLGATYFQLLTSRLPFHDCRTIMQVMSAQITKPPPVPRDWQPDLPEECDRIVAKAMNKAPEERYQSAWEFAEALEAMLQGPTDESCQQVQYQEIDDRPLSSVLIVEPSKLQASMLKAAFSRAGVGSIQVASSGEDARRAVAGAAPDLLITALELPDERGTELLRSLCEQSRLQRSTVILNSSDSTVDDLIASGPASCLILASKKIKTGELLGLANATGPCVVNADPMAAPLDPSTIRVRIEWDSGRIPESLSDLIRELKLLDVEVTSPSLPASDVTPVDIVLALREARQSLTGAGFAALALRGAEAAAIAAAIEVDSGRLQLRAAGCPGAVAVCNRHLDGRRLLSILRSCRL